MHRQNRRRSSVPEPLANRTRTLGNMASRRGSIPELTPTPAGKRRMRLPPNGHTPLQALGGTPAQGAGRSSHAVTPAQGAGRTSLPELGESPAIARGGHYQVLPSLHERQSQRQTPLAQTRRLDQRQAPPGATATAPELKVGHAQGRCYPRDFVSPLPTEACGLLTQHGAVTKFGMMGGFGGPRMNRAMEPKENQDRGMITYPFAGNPRQALFLCGDGHGEHGAFASEQACRMLQEMLASDPRTSDASNASQEQVRQGFVTCFEEVNRRLHKSAKLNKCSGGTTMTAVIIAAHAGSVHMWTAWAGDSRAVLAKTLRRHVELASDHKCDIPAEAARMRKAGGIVMTNEMTGVTRVCVSAGPDSDDVYTLNMSRSMGDTFFHEYGGVVATPDVHVCELGPDDKALILASDGVWEHVESADAANVVMARFLEGKDASALTQSVMDHSMKQWKTRNPAYRDDITAIVVDLPKLTALLDAQQNGEGSAQQQGRQTVPSTASPSVPGTFRKQVAYKQV